MLFPQAPKGTTVFSTKSLQTSTLSHHWFSLLSALYRLATDVLCKSRYRSAFTLARVPLGALAVVEAPVRPNPKPTEYTMDAAIDDDIRAACW